MELDESFRIPTHESFIWFNNYWEFEDNTCIPCSIGCLPVNAGSTDMYLSHSASSCVSPRDWIFLANKRKVWNIAHRFRGDTREGAITEGVRLASLAWEEVRWKRRPTTNFIGISPVKYRPRDEQKIFSGTASKAKKKNPSTKFPKVPEAALCYDNNSEIPQRKIWKEKKTLF